MLLRCRTMAPMLPRTSPMFLLIHHKSPPSCSHLFLNTLRTSAAALPSTSRLSAGSFPGIRRFSAGAQAARSPPPPPQPTQPKRSLKARRKAARESPEGLLKSAIDQCSKHSDVVEALRLYDEAKLNGVPIDIRHYNPLLYLCSSSTADAEAAKRGFAIFNEMVALKVAPNEATFTSLARLAAALEDPEMAFDSVKQMKSFGIEPKLRSYGPALFGFGKKGEAERAYEVDADMAVSGVVPEEPELAALLEVSARANRGDKVYEMLHRLRTTVRQVSEYTAEIIDGWFRSEGSARVGEENWDVERVKEGMAKGGGGWHGQGWLGKGEWRVVRTHMEETGVCPCCGEKLVCIDIDPLETKNFYTSLVKLARKREINDQFIRFQDWLKRHGPFDAVVDGANVGLINNRNMNFNQLKHVVNKLREMSPSKRLPLILLHRSRVNMGPARDANNQKLLEYWKSSGALYATPQGSNDDWYWLYAAVRCKCLLVTNDEMRDHLFELVGRNFFSRWKEKHQVRMSFSKKGLKLHMPPPYSNVIQESESGKWHIPTIIGDDVESPRQWLCATRVMDKSSHQVLESDKNPSTVEKEIRSRGE